MNRFIDDERDRETGHKIKEKNRNRSCKTKKRKTPRHAYFDER